MLSSAAGRTSRLVRLFVAGPLPEALQARVATALTAARRAASQARWVRAEQLHLTLAFLGELDGTTQLPVLQQALQQLAPRHPAVQLWLKGAGCFGRPHQPDVLFAEVAGDMQGLGALHADLQEALRPWLPPSAEAAGSAFRPHLTLARARGRRGDPALRRCARALREQVLGGFLLERLVLFQSELAPSGAQHTRLAEFPLGSGAASQSAHP